MNSIFSSRCILIFLTIFVMVGCNNKSKEEHKTIKELILNDYQKELDPYSIVDTTSYKYIRLETTRESCFADISKVIIDNGRIFILDRDKAKKVFMFDLEGKFICQIGKQGKGPGEYESLGDIDIDTDKKQIVLLDFSSRKLLFYDYNGSFIKNVQLDSYPGMTLGVVASNNYAFFLHTSIEKGEKQLLFYNNAGNLIDQKFDFRNRNVVFGMPDYFARQGDNLYFIPIFNDKMFKLQKDGKMSEVFDFQMADLMITDDDIKNHESPGELLKLKKFFYLSDLSVAKNGQFYCASDYNGAHFSIVGNLENHQIKIGRPFLEMSDMTSPIIGSYEDYFIGTFHPNQSRLKSRFPDAAWENNQGILLFKFHDVFK